MTVTPSRTATIARRVMWGTGPAAMVLLVLWAVQWDVIYDRPHLVLMVYVGLMLAACCSCCVIALARCHMAIQDAFAAGVATGSVRALPHRAPATVTTLRAVE